MPNGSRYYLTPGTTYHYVRGSSGDEVFVPPLQGGVTIMGGGGEDRFHINSPNLLLHQKDGPGSYLDSTKTQFIIYPGSSALIYLDRLPQRSQLFQATDRLTTFAFSQNASQAERGVVALKVTFLAQTSNPTAEITLNLPEGTKPLKPEELKQLNDWYKRSRDIGQEIPPVQFTGDVKDLPVPPQIANCNPPYKAPRMP